jgi:hypothetical protein
VSGAALREVVEAVRSLSYGRPSDRTVEGMLRQGRGTCSTKHLHLARVLAERFPETRPLIVHRVYAVDRETARERFGEHAAQAVPAEGLTDVHRYLTAEVAGRRITIDATFPGPPWDGVSPMPLACGPGTDHPAGRDPDGDKRVLESRYCDPVVREPFIAALDGTEGKAGDMRATVRRLRGRAEGCVRLLAYGASGRTHPRRRGLLFGSWPNRRNRLRAARTGSRTSPERRSA